MKIIRRFKQETPVKRSTSKRTGDFNEIYDDFITEKAKDQSSRCSQCEYPLSNTLPIEQQYSDWLKLTAEG